MTSKIKPKRKYFAYLRRALAVFLISALLTPNAFGVVTNTTAYIRVAPATSTAAANQTGGVARITWTASPSEAGGIDGYRIYYKLSTNDSYTSYTTLDLPAAELTKDIASLTNANYDFKVMAYGFDNIESRSDCASCEITSVAITAIADPDPPASSGGGGGGAPTPTPEPEPEPIVDPTPTVSDETITDPAAPSSSGGGTFTDLTITHWGYSSVQTLTAEGVLSGYPDGSFQPDSLMNRAELTKVALLSFGEVALTHTSAESEPAEFPDIESDSWYTTYVSEAQTRGIISGYGDGYFRPSRSVTRAEALKILIGAAGYEVDTGDLTVTYFQDVSPDDWYASYVVWAAEQGIISGYEVSQSAYTFKRDLKFGSFGKDVGALQYILKKLGHYYGVTSHYFGLVTQAGLRRFQSAEMATETYRAGVLDDPTKESIYKATGLGTSQSYFEFRPNQTITRAEAAQLSMILRDLKQGELQSLKRLQADTSSPTIDLEFDLENIPVEMTRARAGSVSNPRAAIETENSPTLPLKASALEAEPITPTTPWYQRIW